MHADLEASAAPARSVKAEEYQKRTFQTSSVILGNKFVDSHVDDRRVSSSASAWMKGHPVTIDDKCAGVAIFALPETSSLSKFGSARSSVVTSDDKIPSTTSVFILDNCVKR